MMGRRRSLVLLALLAATHAALLPARSCAAGSAVHAALLPATVLRARLCRSRARVIRSAAPDNVLTDEDDLLRQRRAWALIFNYRTENEGIYTQQREDGREYVLTWQAEEDAARYADMLSAQDFPEGTAVEMDVAILLEFCRDAGHQLCLVPSDTVVIPPEANVEQFEWSPGAPHAPPPPPHTLLRYLRLLLAFTSTIRSPPSPPGVSEEASLEPQEMTTEEIGQRRAELERIMGLDAGGGPEAE